MQEQTTSSRWASNPLTWAAKKLFNSASSFITSGKVLAVSFVTQIPTALADYCFKVNGLETHNLLWCANKQQESNLSRDLHLQANVTAAPSYQCADLNQYPNRTTYGKTAFGFDACTLGYGERLDPTVNSVLAKNVQNGIFGGYADINTVIFIVIAGVAFTGIALAAGCRFMKKRAQRQGREEAATERSQLTGNETSADREPGVSYH